MLLLGWAAVIVAGIAVVSWVLRNPGAPRGLPQNSYPPLPAPPPPETPREILDRRFAAGEIDIEEYAERRAAIEEPLLPDHPYRKRSDPESEQDGKDT